MTAKTPLEGQIITCNASSNGFRPDSGTSSALLVKRDFTSAADGSASAGFNRCSPVTKIATRSIRLPSDGVHRCQFWRLFSNVFLLSIFPSSLHAFCSIRPCRGNPFLREQDEVLTNGHSFAGFDPALCVHDLSITWSYMLIPLWLGLTMSRGPCIVSRAGKRSSRRHARHH